MKRLKALILAGAIALGALMLPAAGAVAHGACGVGQLNIGRPYLVRSGGTATYYMQSTSSWNCSSGHARVFLSGRICYSFNPSGGWTCGGSSSNVKYQASNINVVAKSPACYGWAPNQPLYWSTQVSGTAYNESGNPIHVVTLIRGTSSGPIRCQSGIG